MAARQRRTGGGGAGRSGEAARRPRCSGVAGTRCTVGALRARSGPAGVRRGGTLHHADRIGNGLGTGGGAVQRVPQRQEERRDDALDRARPRGGRAVLLPRPGPRAVGHDDHAPKVIRDRGYGREQADERGRSGVRHRTARGRRRAHDSLSRRTFARHEPAVGDQRHRGRPTGYGRRRPGPDLRDDRTWRQGRAVLARGPARAAAVPVLAAARPSHQRRPGVCAVCPRLSRGNASLPHVRRRGHAPSDVGRDREGRGNRSASNGRLIRREHSLSPYSTVVDEGRTMTAKTRLELGAMGVLAAMTCGAPAVYGQMATGDSGARPVILAFSYTGELVQNAGGGARPGTTFAGAAGGEFTLLLRRLVGWHGARIFVFVLGTHGGAPSDLVGDV